MGASMAGGQLSDPEKAVMFVAPHLLEWERKANQPMIDGVIFGLALAAYESGETATAALLAGYGAGTASWEMQPPQARGELHLALIGELGDAALEPLLAQGAKLTFEEARNLVHEYLDARHPAWRQAEGTYAR